MPSRPYHCTPRSFDNCNIPRIWRYGFSRSFSLLHWRQHKQHVSINIIQWQDRYRMKFLKRLELPQHVSRSYCSTVPVNVSDFIPTIYIGQKTLTCWAFEMKLWSILCHHSRFIQTVLRQTRVALREKTLNGNRHRWPLVTGKAPVTLFGLQMTPQR